MKQRSATILTWIFALLSLPAQAHRLDEYLQATTVSLAKDRVQIQLELTPGVAVFPYVIAMIDTDRDGAISPQEQRVYAEQVLADLSLKFEGSPLAMRIQSFSFPALEQMQEGMGEIRLELAANLPWAGRERELTFENRHGRAFSAYLVNCLSPADREIQVVRQNRNFEQSSYQLAYTQDGVADWASLGPVWAGGLVSLLLLRIVALGRRRISLLNRFPPCAG